MRAWSLGMFVPRDGQDEQVVRRGQSLLVLPAEPAEADLATPIGLRLDQEGASQDPARSEQELTPLTDKEYLDAFDGLVERYLALKAGYDRGMLTATTPEQEQQLAELRSLLDD